MFDVGFELDFTSGIRDNFFIFVLPSPRLYLKSKKTEFLLKRNMEVLC